MLKTRQNRKSLEINQSKGDCSVLFFTPDYHCSFFLRDELRRRGWKADIFVPRTYPVQFLFSEQDVLVEKSDVVPDVTFRNLLRLALAQLRRVALQRQYRFVLHYGSLGQTISKQRMIEKMFHAGLLLSYWFLRLGGTRIVYLPAGCRNERLREDWEKIDGGNVCLNCGYADRCDDAVNSANFDLVRRATDLRVGWDPQITKEYSQTFFRYKSLDLDVFHPGITIPPHLRIERESPTSLIILHSYVMGDRNWMGRNIKGSLAVGDAVERLRSEGYDVQLVNPTNVQSSEMRFLQSQADVVVDQLIYGIWGSTSLESLALGRPVVCYLRPEWQIFLADLFPECKEMPIVSADTSSILDVLRNLVADSSLRDDLGKKGRRFAEQFLDVKKNCSELITQLEQL